MCDSRFRREADENCTLLSHYAAISGNFLPTFRDIVQVAHSGFKNAMFLKVPFSGYKIPRFLSRDDGIDMLSRNVGKKLSLLAA